MEIWKDVEGYEGYYQVSNFSRIKSLKRRFLDKKGVMQAVGEKILIQTTGKDGYSRVDLFKDSKRTGKTVHRRIANAFIPNPDNKPCVNHINGIKNDNRLENIEWVTKSENAIHAVSIGLVKNGENHCCAKLTESQALMIKYQHKGELHRNIAETYGVKSSLIGAIRKGKAWKHI